MSFIAAILAPTSDTNLAITNYISVTRKAH
ncbi:hypothetical protein HNP68_001147 [Borrelia yangtzensis]|uniref:Uncharacterized protein n=1 Tax=Borreliella yangtzensis TaxID=683292 RepID=A0ABR6PD83_9SPIR|nr:hypothetical protein [Borreliella yangtzensis]